jgi:hypothetical protein
MSYATREQLYLLALAAPAFVAYARPFDAVDATTATIRLKGHGLSVNNPITFEGSSGGYLPTDITEFSVYYAQPITSDLFQVSETLGGFPIASWTEPGEGWAIAIDPGPRLDAILEERSAFIDEHLTAHEPPIQVDAITGKYPQVLIGICARLTARQAIASLESENPQYRIAIDRLLASEEADNLLLKTWKDGKPIQPRPTDENTALDNAAVARSGRDSMGWSSGRFGL